MRYFQKMNDNSVYKRIFNNHSSIYIKNDSTTIKEEVKINNNNSNNNLLDKNNILDNYHDKIIHKNLIDNSLIKYIGFFHPNNNVNINHPILPLKLCKSSPIKNINSKDILDKLKLIQKKYAGIKHKIGFSICRICYNNNKCNEFYLDYFVWPAGYIHYLEDHNVLIDPLFENYIKNFDFNGQHFRDFDYTY